MELLLLWFLVIEIFGVQIGGSKDLHFFFSFLFFFFFFCLRACSSLKEWTMETDE